MGGVLECEEVGCGTGQEGATRGKPVENNRVRREEYRSAVRKREGEPIPRVQRLEGQKKK